MATLIRVQPEGAQVHRFDPTANVRQRHKRRLRFARKWQAVFEDYCQTGGMAFVERKTKRQRTAWIVRRDGQEIVSWVPELGRAYVPEMSGIVFKIHDPFVLSWFIDGLREAKSS